MLTIRGKAYPNARQFVHVDALEGALNDLNIEINDTINQDVLMLTDEINSITVNGVEQDTGRNIEVELEIVTERETQTITTWTGLPANMTASDPVTITWNEITLGNNTTGITMGLDGFLDLGADLTVGMPASLDVSGTATYTTQQALTGYTNGAAYTVAMTRTSDNTIQYVPLQLTRIFDETTQTVTIEFIANGFVTTPGYYNHIEAMKGFDGDVASVDGILPDANGNVQTPYAQDIASVAADIPTVSTNGTLQVSSVAGGYEVNAGNASLATVAVGTGAGADSQGGEAIAIGDGAGNYAQGNGAVAIGQQAGNYSQGTYSIAIGGGAGDINQGNGGVAIGQNAGKVAQGAYAFAFGEATGENYQGANSIALGNNAASQYQYSGSIVLGLNSDIYNNTRTGTATPTDGDTVVNAVSVGEYVSSNPTANPYMRDTLQQGRTIQGVANPVLPNDAVNLQTLNPVTTAISNIESGTTPVGMANQAMANMVVTGTNLNFNSYTTAGTYWLPVTLGTYTNSPTGANPGTSAGFLPAGYLLTVWTDPAGNIWQQAFSTDQGNNWSDNKFLRVFHATPAAWGAWNRYPTSLAGNQILATITATATTNIDTLSQQNIYVLSTITPLGTVPTGFAGTNYMVINYFATSALQAQMAINMTTGVWMTRSYNSAIWSAWQSLSTNYSNNLQVFTQTTGQSITTTSPTTFTGWTASRTNSLITVSGGTFTLANPGTYKVVAIIGTTSTNNVTCNAQITPVSGCTVLETSKVSVLSNNNNINAISGGDTEFTVISTTANATFTFNSVYNYSTFTTGTTPSYGIRQVPTITINQISALTS